MLSVIKSLFVPKSRPGSLCASHALWLEKHLEDLDEVWDDTPRPRRYAVDDIPHVFEWKRSPLEELLQHLECFKIDLTQQRLETSGEVKALFERDYRRLHQRLIEQVLEWVPASEGKPLWSTLENRMDREALIELLQRDREAEVEMEIRINHKVADLLERRGYTLTWNPITKVMNLQIAQYALTVGAYLPEE